jgi:hypothetical protein
MMLAVCACRLLSMTTWDMWLNTVGMHARRIRDIWDAGTQRSSGITTPACSSTCTALQPGLPAAVKSGPQMSTAVVLLRNCDSLPAGSGHQQGSSAQLSGHCVVDSRYSAAEALGPHRSLCSHHERASYLMLPDALQRPAQVHSASCHTSLLILANGDISTLKQVS